MQKQIPKHFKKIYKIQKNVLVSHSLSFSPSLLHVPTPSTTAAAAARFLRHTLNNKKIKQQQQRQRQQNRISNPE